MPTVFQVADWINLALHFLSLSLLCVGGAITTAPDMHRYLVVQKSWLTDPEFSASIALAQAAPGPNILFVALLGWHTGLHAAGDVGMAQGWPQGLLGAFISMIAIMLPSSLLNYFATQWAWRRREWAVVRAFKQGMSPIVVALLIATAWVLSSAHDQFSSDWPLWLLTGISALVVWRTRLHLLWLLAAGAALGAWGWV